jgi:hypothetical protein
MVRSLGEGTEKQLLMTLPKIRKAKSPSEKKPRPEEARDIEMHGRSVG